MSLEERYEIIFDDENIIGRTTDIERYIKDTFDEDNEFYSPDWEELGTELLEELDNHDGYVLCAYHPMGAYTVFDLSYEYEKGKFYKLC